MQHYLDASVIFAVVLINAVIGYFQEAKAESALTGLSELMAPTAVALRDGKRMDITASELVVGDLVVGAVCGVVSQRRLSTYSQKTN